MKLIRIVAIGMAAAFAAGFLLAYFNFSSPNNHIPTGTYAPVLLVEGAALSYDESTVSINPMTSDVTLWIREDREDWFMTETKTMAKSTLTKVVVNCGDQHLSIVEQRSFGPHMMYMGERAGLSSVAGMNTPMELAAVLTVCYPSADDRPAPKSRPPTNRRAPSSIFPEQRTSVSI
jgi:hypothetical protein